MLVVADLSSGAVSAPGWCAGAAPGWPGTRGVAPGTGGGGVEPDSDGGGMAPGIDGEGQPPDLRVVRSQEQSGLERLALRWKEQ